MAEELEMEIEAYGYATDLMHLLDLDESDKATWNMKSEGMRCFVDGLTALAALPCDDRGIQIRRMLLGQGTVCVQNVVDALKCREVLLKCKSASALGSICMCNSSSIALMKNHRDAIMKGLTRMVAGKNRWAQGDATFVLGWIVRWEEDEDTLQLMLDIVPKMCEIVNSSLKILESEQTMDDESMEDCESNLRIYPFVFLLNLCRHRSLSTHENMIIATINSAIQAVLNGNLSEKDDIAQLSISLLYKMVDSEGSKAIPLILSHKMLPSIAKLSRQLAEENIKEQCLELLKLIVDKTH
ncbi:hypothetical protein THRCLA_01247 [Thraustotheca clavata]|uniref:Uncharacterized protein n=1 Tax=Thraustotheca clavata TaxID=74557 RepID=A0A1W0A924_9STRA|nr:hypothetical protein THRCLA_01247 [Thraustotheca clavata]